MLTQLFNVIRPASFLVGIKCISIAFSFTLYSICIFYFNENFAVTHASFMLVFGVFKSGAGFEAISTGASALSYVTKNLITRIFLSLTWLYLLAIFVDMKLTLIVLLSIPIGLLWLKSFDGHILGSNAWSIIYSLIPSVTVGILGVFLLLGFESTLFVIEGNQKILVGILVGALIMYFFHLRGSLKNTLSEMLHATVSPLLVLAMANFNSGSNGFEFILYKIFEGLSQVILFVLSSGKSKKILEYFNFSKLSLIVFIVLLCSLGVSHFLGGYLSHLIFGAFILCYYLSSFFVVKYMNHVNFVLIPMILLVTVLLEKVGFFLFQYLIFTLPIFLFFLNKISGQKLKNSN